jgi:NADH-ubiquinone oxidoreductase chain 2
MIFISILILIVAIALPSFNKQISPILFTRISSIIFLYAGALSFNALYIQSIGSGIGIYSGLFHVTFVSQLLEVFLLITGSLILIAWPLKASTVSNKTFNLQTLSSNLELKSESRNTTATEYSLIVLFTTLGASLLISSADLVSMYLSIELQSFGLYILATLYRESESATSAGLKYFLLGGLSSCLILLGAGLIYTFTGLTNFESIYSLISVSDSHNIIQGLSLGFILIIVGFLFKIAAAPLHNWAPDVYDDSPTIVTIWLTIMPKISILILLLELQVQIGFLGELTSLSLVSSPLLEQIGTSTLDVLNSYLGSSVSTGGNTLYIIKNLLLISSLLSLIIGTVVGLAQTRIKRLLAYSTISHLGFILLALAINTEQSIDSMIFYIIQYSLTNLNTFLIIIALGYLTHNSIHYLNTKKTNNSQYITSNSSYVNLIKSEGGKEKDINLISELKGQFFSNPLLSLSLTVSLFSMAGIPPLIGFFSKQFVLYSAVQSGYYFMAIVAILVSVVSASYYLKIIRVLHSEAEGNIIAPSLPQSEGGTHDVREDTLSSLKLDSNSEINLSSKIENLTAESSVGPSNVHSFLISSLTLSILLFVLKPSIILNSTQLLSLSLYNF